MIDKLGLAAIVDLAALNAEAIEQLSVKNSFTEEEAYAIQAESMNMRYMRGEKFVGLKLGFTSRAKMEQMGVHDMIWGRLTDSMLMADGDRLDLSKFIHPRAEPEICFLVKRDLNQEITLEDAPHYIEGVAAAIEVIDSRYKNFKFSLEDVIADNCSSSAFVVGEFLSVDTPVNHLKMDLKFDGEVKESGSSEAILGNPWESVVNAARLAKKYGQSIPTGSYIMAGASTGAVFLEQGTHVSVDVEGMGSVGFDVK